MNRSWNNTNRNKEKMERGAESQRCAGSAPVGTEEPIVNITFQLRIFRA